MSVAAAGSLAPTTFGAHAEGPGGAGSGVRHRTRDAGRAAGTSAAALVLAIFGGALILASRRAADYVGPAAFGAGVAEIVLAVLLLLRVRHAGTVGVVAATAGLVLSGFAALVLVAGRDPFVALGGAGGEPKNTAATIALVACGHLVALAGARQAR